MGGTDVIREAFSEAGDYRKAWDIYNRRKAAGENLIPPRRDLKQEPLVEVVEGKRLVHIHGYRSDEIGQMIRVADEFHFEVATFQHVLEGYKVADEIAKSGAGGSSSSDWRACRWKPTSHSIQRRADVRTRRGGVDQLRRRRKGHAPESGPPRP